MGDSKIHESVGWCSRWFSRGYEQVRVFPPLPVAANSGGANMWGSPKRINPAKPNA